jgi:hypothetical protein
MGASLLALLPACGTEGALSQSVFTPECEEDDLACIHAGLDAPIAVGGVQPLSINLDVPGTTTPPFELVSANPGVLKVSGNEITGENPGVSALVMMAEGDIALDFLHVWVETPNRIAIERDGEEIIGAIELLAGDELSLSVAPYKNITRLLGGSSGDWTVSSDAVSVLQDGNPRRRRVVARDVGTTTLTVSCFDLEATIDLVVLP